MRPIDAVHLKSMLQEYIKREQAYIDIGNNTSVAIGHSNGLWEAIAQIDEEPTVEPQRVSGKWHLTDAYPHWLCCDQCHKKMLPNAEWVELYNIPTNFCPNCGAWMGGTDDANC